MKAVAVLVLAILPILAAAELQNVQVGGKIEIYGAWYSDLYEANPAQRVFPDFLLLRPIGPNMTRSVIRAGNGGNNLSFFEQRTRLHLEADLTQNVLAFIEMDSIDTWGEDFRSGYLSGIDSRANSTGDAEIFQAYIAIDDICGRPLQLRLGRQEMEYGSGWLVGADPGPDPFVGLSFDAARLTLDIAPVTVNAWASKIADTSPVEEDGDLDFYGVYATFAEGDEQYNHALHWHSALFPLREVCRVIGLTKPEGAYAEFDAYWLYLRDALRRADTEMPPVNEWLEDLFRFDDYGPTNLHTFGMRGAGQYRNADWEVEAAYQYGDADANGALFKPIRGIYGDHGARWDNWAGHAEIGWTFSVPGNPRLYIGGAYYEGRDTRDINVMDWLDPFHQSRASVSFNRLFSSWREDAFIDASAMTNFWKAYAGIAAAVSEKINVTGALAYFEAVEPFSRPAFPPLSLITREGDSDIGWQLSLGLVYACTEALNIEIGYSHFFTGNAIEDGVFVDENGFTNIGGRQHDDADYVCVLTTVEF